jgi:UDP-3-O-[3-hydroxymyristoyl] glucosamine N-acyltransferase
MPSSRALRLSDIASQLGGEVLGPPDTAVSGIATLASAGPADISFLSNARYRRHLESTRAGAVIVARAERDATGLPRIVCEDPYAYYARLAELLHPAAIAEPGVHASAIVEQGADVRPSASVGARCHIGRGAVIGDRAALGPGCAIGAGARIGDDSRLHALVSVYDGCVMGRRTIVHSGAVIGADGFGMAREGEGWRKIPQLGRVLIGDDVEIGANTAIDRGALDDTVIEDGVKLDNLIQVGHNVRIGAHSALAGCVGIAGSTRIGRRCTVGGGTVILGHLELCDDVHIAAASVVTRSIAEPGEYAGLYPLQQKKDWARNAVLLRNLERLQRRVETLERALGVAQSRGATAPEE